MAIGIREIRKIEYKYILAPLALIIVVLISGFSCLHYYSQKDFDENSINIALVQPNISFEDKFQEDSSVLIPEPYSKSSYFKPGTDLVVYPESVLWGSMDREKNKSFARWAREVLRKENLHLLSGQILWDSQKNYYNSVLLYSSDLKMLGRYNKIHPLPFAEYMPYPNILGFLKFLNIAKLNITPDRDFTLINYPGRGQIGSNICFESTLPVISRTFREKCADIIFVVTDDAGFRDSLASWHHVIFSTARAVENSSYVVHSSNLGVSAVIDPVGRIRLQTRLGTKGVFYSRVAFIEEKSIYSKVGNLFLYLYFSFSIIYLVYYLFKKGNSISISDKRI
jgi:apolipoprotein N-acyltransferase